MCEWKEIESHFALMYLHVLAARRRSICQCHDGRGHGILAPGSCPAVLATEQASEASVGLCWTRLGANMRPNFERESALWEEANLNFPLNVKKGGGEVTLACAEQDPTPVHFQREPGDPKQCGLLLASLPQRSRSPSSCRSPLGMT